TELVVVYAVVVGFFFSSRRRHTRFSRDWSSDVCSSDLGRAPRSSSRRRCQWRRLLFRTRSAGRSTTCRRPCTAIPITTGARCEHGAAQDHGGRRAGSPGEAETGRVAGAPDGNAGTGGDAPAQAPAADPVPGEGPGAADAPDGNAGTSGDTPSQAPDAGAHAAAGGPAAEGTPGERPEAADAPDGDA